MLHDRQILVEAVRAAAEEVFPLSSYLFCALFQQLFALRLHARKLGWLVVDLELLALLGEGFFLLGNLSKDFNERLLDAV